MRRVVTSTAALWLWLEASLIAVVYPALALGGVRRPRAAAIVLGALAATLAVHAAVAAAAWSLAGGPGDAHALLVTRACLGGLALAAWGLAATLGRTRLEPGVAAAVTALLMLLLVWGPATGEALAGVGSSPATFRSLGFAVSAPYAASVALRLDVIHAPGLYGLVPAAQLEMHMTTWILSLIHISEPTRPY